MNTMLKAKIIEKYGKQWAFARDIGVDPSMVSMIVTGARELPESEKTRWASKLGATTDIFNEKNKLVAA